MVKRSIYCCKCKKEKEPGREKESYCKKCKSEARSARLSLKRQQEGLPEYGTGRKFTCSKCGSVKENRDRSYCNDCTNAKFREKWREVTAPNVNQREVTLICECGKQKKSSRKIYCDDCLKTRRNEKDKERRLNLRNLLVKKGIIVEKKPLTEDEKVIRKAARDILQRSIKQGRIKRLSCEKCGSSINVEAHHDDYTKPLEVIWLCREHHAEHHRLYPNLED